MIAPNQHPSRFRIGTYTSGQPYSPARGRYAPRKQVEDRIAECCPVIDLPREQPDWRVFLQKIVRELRIRFYQRKTIKNYKRALESFLLWFGVSARHRHGPRQRGRQPADASTESRAGCGVD